MSAQEEITRLQAVLDSNDWSDKRASILLPFEDTTKIKEVASQYQDAQAIVIIGIGGSNLGAWAIHEAINGPYHNESSTPKVYFADTPDAHALTQLKKQLEDIKGRIVYVVISKSGSTAETIANASILVEDWKDAIIITGKNSKIDKHQGAQTLYIQEQVGGRYSVFSAVGLLPLAIIGIDIDNLLTGAQAALQNINAIADKAIQEHEANKQISEAFFFAPLQRLGQWRRQLIAESLGKDGKGMMPTTRIGSTDLHSTAQRSIDGPNDTYTTFVFIQESPEILIPKNNTSNNVDDLGNKTTKQLFEAIQQGVIDTYKEHNRPYTTITLEAINEASIASLMQTWMIQTMIHAKLLEINAFDQPAVEHYKTHTKEHLRSS